MAKNSINSSADSRSAVVSYMGKYVHLILVNRLEGLSLPRNSVVGLTDRPDMTIAVYRGRKEHTTTTILENWSKYLKCCGIPWRYTHSPFLIFFLHLF